MTLQSPASFDDVLCSFSTYGMSQEKDSESLQLWWVSAAQVCF